MPKRRRDDWAATASNALSYTIDSCSSISANFQPHFIKDEAPDDLSSRWSGAPSSSNPSQQSQQPRGPVYFGDSPAGPSSLPFDDIIRAGDSAAVRRVRELARDRQYILLRLDQLALVQSITFGKPSKPNPCNIKDADVYCGRDKQHLSHALRVTMANDPHYESFSIPHTSSLCRYIMICPVSTHAPNYNPSVWFIGVQGSIDRSKVHNAWRLLANVSQP